MEPIEQTDNFRRVYQFATETNRSVFLTGKAGTGKTTLLKYIRDNCFKQISVVAPTGVAAINAGGSTIHSFFQLPFGPFVPPVNKQVSSSISKHLMATIKLNKNRLHIMRQLDLLIIDEISMVRCDVLDAIDVVLRSVRRRLDLPFGGVQVIMVGDMYQLPPVVKEEEWQLLQATYQSPFFFDSHIVKEVKPVYIELEKIFRQEEPVFIDLLNKVRNNLIDDATIALLNSRYRHPEDIGSDAIMLTTHNHMADNINNKELQKLPGTIKSYQAEISGSFPEKSYPAEENLQLKVGAKVMFIKNDLNKRYFNGKTGVIKKLEEERIIVTCNDDKTDVYLLPELWENMQYGIDKSTNTITEEVLGSFKQYPLRLAWAITIHKSQGLTFDKVVIDAAQAFSSGQVYVALSRCRSLEGIILKSNINKRSLSNDEKIVSFAATKTPEQEVQTAYINERRNFTQGLLNDLFSLHQIQEEYIQLEKKYIELRSQFLTSDDTWLSTQQAGIVALKQVSEKFRQELHQLFANNVAPDLLHHRLQKAGTYFTTQLNGNLTSLKQCPYITESVTTAKELTFILDELYGLMQFKIHMLKVCEAPFDLQAYARLRQQYQLPEFKFNVYVTERKQKDHSGIPHPALFALLSELRDEICNKQNKPVYMVANKNSLVALCTYLPTNKPDLMKIAGFGKAKVESIGPAFLEIINDYLDLNDLPTAMHLLIEEPKAKTNSGVVRTFKGDTAKISFDLFKEGKSIEAIAQLRNMVPGTVETHLTKYIASGEIPVESLLSKEKITYLTTIYEANPEFKTLTEFKNLCGEDITYSNIRVFIASKKPIEKEAVN